MYQFRREPIVATDVGGTKILTVVIDADGKILASDYRPTVALRPFDEVIEDILDAITKVTIQSKIEPSDSHTIGLALAGISNPTTGVLHRSPHLPGWCDVPVEDIIEKKTGKKVFLINDANAAALGEMTYGAAQGVKNFIYVTVSTGIGGGIVVDGELYTGATGLAGEIGTWSSTLMGHLAIAET